MKAFHKTFVQFIFLTVAITVSAQNQENPKSMAEEMVRAAVTDPALSQAAVSICIRTGDGRTLAEHNPGMMSVPASNVKMLTTGAALHHFRSGHRFGTRIGYVGEIKDGTLEGDIYIMGGGDPTLGSKDTIATDINRIFAKWEQFIRAAGIRKINGHIVGDGRWFNGMAEEETWLWNDIGTYYGTGVTGLMFYENMLSFIAEPGRSIGAPVSIEPYYPKTPWMNIRYSGITADKGTGDRLFMYTTSLSPTAEITGTFGIDRGRKRIDCSNKYPEYTCATYFCQWLEDHGIGCTAGPADFTLTSIMPADEKDIRTIGTTYSPELRRIAFTTNHASNNLYADTLLKSLGKELGESSEYPESVSALMKVLQGMGIDTGRGIHLRDGSGLSRQNYVSADFFCRFLEAMMRSEEFESYVSSLPSPGSEGSLAYNMKNQPEALRERIKIKSGSMNGVRCYSGYIIPTSGAKDETIIFSILTSNCTAPTWKVRPLLDKLMAGLASLN